MPALTINVYVSPRAAIMAGKATVGSQSFTVTEDALVALSPELRLELALAYENNEAIGASSAEPPVIEATMDAVLPVLTARAEQRKHLEKAKQIDDARKAEMAVVDARERTAKDNARSRALRLWVEKNGDDEQRARMAEGFLPEDEILDSVTDELIDISGFNVYEPLRRGDACDCGCAHRVNFTKSVPPQYMDAFQFEKLQRVRENAPEGATVTPVEHRAACPDCKCVPIARVSALVTFAWHGWELVREFSLA
jgi:hypothetical protein